MDCHRAVLLKEGYLLERFDDEIIVYHLKKATSLYLNETGALIWELCDSKRTIEDIITVLTELYPEAREQIARDVKKVIGQLTAAGIAVLG